MSIHPDPTSVPVPELEGAGLMTRAVIIEGARRGDVISVAANTPRAALDTSAPLDRGNEEEAQLLALLDRIVSSAQGMERNAHAARNVAEANLDGLKRVRVVMEKLHGSF